MSKRTLPTVTPEQVLKAMQEHKACWLESKGLFGTVLLIDRLFGNCPTMTLNYLNELVRLRRLSSVDAAWITKALGTALKPADFPDTGNFEEDLEAWENPKPKRPRISELKPGTKYKTKYNKNNDRVYTKLGNFRDVVVRQEFSNLCFMTADFTIDAHLADEEVEVVE